MLLRNVYELMGAVLASLALYSFLIQLSMPNIRGIRWVALAFLSGSAGTILIVLRGIAPALFTEVLAGALAMSVNVFVYWGFTDLLRFGPRSWSIVWLTVLPEVALIAWFTYVRSSVPSRIFVYSFFTAVQYVLLAQLLLKNKLPQTRLPRYILAGMYIFWTAVRLAGMSGIATRQMALYQSLSSPVTSVAPIIQIFTATLTGLGFVWLAMTVLHADLEYLSSTDALTGLLNRRALEEAAMREITVAQRKQTTLSLVILDLDQFKTINDIYGHAIGDSVLALTAWCLRENLRSVDFIARIGGEEFVALLPDTEQETASEIAERLRAAICELRIDNSLKPVRFTASFGVTTFSARDFTWEEMLRRGDRALYRAKNSGRNCVELETTGDRPYLMQP